MYIQLYGSISVNHIYICSQLKYPAVLLSVWIYSLLINIIQQLLTNVNTCRLHSDYYCFHISGTNSRVPTVPFMDQLLYTIDDARLKRSLLNFNSLFIYIFFFTCTQTLLSVFIPLLILTLRFFSYIIRSEIYKQIWKKNKQWFSFKRFYTTWHYLHTSSLFSCVHMDFVLTCGFRRPCTIMFIPLSGIGTKRIVCK